jgi:hypothetical protein
MMLETNGESYRLRQIRIGLFPPLAESIQARHPHLRDPYLPGIVASPRMTWWPPHHLASYTTESDTNGEVPSRSCIAQK